MNEILLIIDFGSQYTQLIARRVRELNVCSEIVPFNKFSTIPNNTKGIILSGGPSSVTDANTPSINLEIIRKKIPLLALCYGAQLIAHKLGGKVEKSTIREYGRSNLSLFGNTKLFSGVKNNSQVWMSHGDTILDLPNNIKTIASTDDVSIAAFSINNEETFGLQFHPEVYHTTHGKTILSNFLINICSFTQDWTSESFIDSTINDLKLKIGNEKVLMALSGGVDSTVSAVLLNRAIGNNLYCVFVVFYERFSCFLLVFDVIVFLICVYLWYVFVVLSLFLFVVCDCLADFSLFVAFSLCVLCCYVFSLAVFPS